MKLIKIYIVAFALLSFTVTYYYIVTLIDSGIDPINGYIYLGTK